MSGSLYARFLPFIWPYRGRLALAFLATLARPALNAAKVWLLKVLIDDVIRAGRPTLLLGVCVAYLAITVAKGGATFVDDYLGGRVGGHVVRDLRASLYDHLQGLSLRFYHGQRLGDLLTRLSGDTAAIEDLLVSGLTDLVAHAVTIVVFLAILVALDASLASVTLLVLPGLGLASLRYARASRSAQLQVRERTSLLTSIAEEGLSAIALVKAFAREPFEQQRFGGALQGVLGARIQSSRLRALFSPTVDIIATLGTVLVVWFGGQAVLQGRLSLGSLVVFLGYLGSLYAPIQGLSHVAGLVQRAHVGAERVAELFSAPRGVRERRSRRPLVARHGLVQFQQVSFGYTPERPVLRGLSLEIAPGEIVGLVGASGAGKTTVVSLLLGYYDPDVGSVLVDGQDLRDVDPRSLRRQVAAVLQEPMLFQASVAENLRYGRLDATDGDIEAAAQLAAADEFIRALPEGYATPVGPRGARLSGGQRQRLALARALLRDAPIVVLDEATSALDAVTEARVLAGLRAGLAGRSVLLVAHRLSTVRQADRIVVLDAGRVVEQGTHDELLRKRGAYYHFYLAQVGEPAHQASLQAAPVSVA